MYIYVKRRACTNQYQEVGFRQLYAIDINSSTNLCITMCKCRGGFQGDCSPPVGRNPFHSGNFSERTMGNFCCSLDLLIFRVESLQLS